MSFQDIINKSLSANINGLEFYFNSISDAFGNKAIINELPNGKRYFRFHGEDESIFSIKGYIEYDKYEDIKNILKTQTVVSLYIPYFGKKKVYITKISSSIDKKQIGLIDFEFTATVSSNNVDSLAFTVEDFVVIAFNSNVKLKANLLDKFRDSFRSASTFISSIRANVLKVSGIMNSIRVTVGTVIEEAQLLVSSLNTFASSAVGLISTPVSLINRVDNLIESFVNVFEETDNKIDALFNLSDNTKPAPVLTNSNLNENTTLANNYYNSTVLGLCITRINDIIIQKNNIYELESDQDIEVLEKLKKLTEDVYDADIKQQIISTIDSTISYIKLKTQFTKRKRIIEIDSRTPSTVLCYNIYGDLLLLNNFLNWNNITEGAVFEKNDKVIYYI